MNMKSLKETNERKQNRAWVVHIQFNGTPLVVIVIIVIYYSKNEKRINERREKRESIELFIFPGADI